jgi:hypothetical protein
MLFVFFGFFMSHLQFGLNPTIQALIVNYFDKRLQGDKMTGSG